MEVKKKAEITVGSVVRVIKAMREGEKQYIGKLGMVMSVIGEVTLDSFFELTAKRRLKVQIESDFIWLDEDQVQLFAREKQKVSEPEGTAHKFTVGDYVVFIDGSNVPGALTWLSGMKKYVGKRDRIQYMGSEGRTCKLEYIPFWLNLEWIKPAELKLSPKRTIVIEITDDGADAKYVFGKEVEKTASIKRHPNDKPDDEMAAMFVMQKLFGYNLRNIEKAADEKIRLNEEAIRWICGAKEALDEAEKRTRKLLN